MLHVKNLIREGEARRYTFNQVVHCKQIMRRKIGSLTGTPALRHASRQGAPLSPSTIQCFSTFINVGRGEAGYDISNCINVITITDLIKHIFSRLAQMGMSRPASPKWH